jgi:hypothetical protein
MFGLFKRRAIIPVSAPKAARVVPEAPVAMVIVNRVLLTQAQAATLHAALHGDFDDTGHKTRAREIVALMRSSGGAAR